MRIWSLHPSYLDPKGLSALWREGLLALAVLKGSTKGYRNHPQLHRFLRRRDPVDVMKSYLWFVYVEATARGYHFNPAKLNNMKKCHVLRVTEGQLQYEHDHLKKKLMIRSPKTYEKLNQVQTPMPHPLFKCVPGTMEEWEKVR